jgi:hypothetical protein
MKRPAVSPADKLSFSFSKFPFSFRFVMRLLTFFACSAAAGLAVGFVLNAVVSRNDRLGVSKGEGGIRHADISQKSPSGTGNAIDSPLAAVLQARLSEVDGPAQWLEWMAALEKAGPADFPALARLAKDLPGALNLLASRWIGRDAGGLFELCRNPGRAGADLPMEELSRLLMESWPARDPDAVVSALRKYPVLSSSLKIPALTGLFPVRTEEAVRLMREPNVDAAPPGSLEAVRKWAAADPRHAVEVLISTASGYASEQFLEEAGRVWAGVDPAAALAFADQSKHPDAHLLAKGAMGQWAEADLPAASAWLAGASVQERERLLPAFVASWAKKDASAALDWGFENSPPADHFRLVWELFQGDALRDPAVAAAQAAGLEDESGRVNAAMTFAQKATLGSGSWWLDSSAGGAVLTPEAAAWLGGLDEKSREAVVRQLSRGEWGRHSPESFAAFLLTPDAGTPGEETLTAAGGNFVRMQPAEALAWAAKTPEATREAVVAGTFQEWNRLQPDAAMDWLARQPADDPQRRSLYLGAVRKLVPYSAYGLGSEDDSPLGPPREAPAKLAGLLATDPAAAREAIGRLNFTTEERANILNRLRLATGTQAK